MLFGPVFSISFCAHLSLRSQFSLLSGHHHKPGSVACHLEANSSHCLGLWLGNCLQSLHVCFAFLVLLDLVFPLCVLAFCSSLSCLILSPFAVCVQAALFAIDELFADEYKPIPLFVSVMCICVCL